ncbi:MAG: hypothetical protein K9K21_01335 [Desulfotignum sp.]|nr:hypothetical protein [Desulfotignum sp.]
MTRSENITAFPSSKQADWKDRFGKLYDQGNGTMLGFAFTTIREKRALLELYEAVPKILKDYPEVVEKFFKDADIAFDIAEKSVEDARRKNAPGDPEQLIHFNKTGAKQ